MQIRLVNIIKLMSLNIVSLFGDNYENNYYNECYFGDLITNPIENKSLYPVLYSTLNFKAEDIIKLMSNNEEENFYEDTLRNERDFKKEKTDPEKEIERSILTLIIGILILLFLLISFSIFLILWDRENRERGNST